MRSLGFELNKKMLYEVYLDVALRFAKNGDFRQADRTLATLRKVLRQINEASEKQR